MGTGQGFSAVLRPPGKGREHNLLTDTWSLQERNSDTKDSPALA